MMSNNVESISDLVKQIVAAAEPLNREQYLPEKQRQQLIHAAEKLTIATRKPAENVYFIATQIAQNAAYRCAIAMGVFETLPDDGRGLSSKALARKLNVNEGLLERILRACASTHLFNEVSPSHFAHNTLSRAFLLQENRDQLAQMYDFTSKGVFALPEYLASKDWREHGSYEDGPFQLGAHTELGFWEYLQEDPRRMQLFNSGMRSQSTIGHGPQSGSYPFGPELANACQEDEVLIVDLGGGRGQSLEAIKQEYPELKGKFVLQDMEHVIANAKSKGLPAFIEPVVGSFFEEQKIEGARVYYFRRIFHDWDDEKSRQILENTRKAMNEYSRIVIADMVLPDIHASREQALQDLNMMSFGGMERTEMQWQRLLGDSGLKLRKIWQNAAGAKHAAIEAVLP